MSSIFTTTLVTTIVAPYDFLKIYIMKKSLKVFVNTKPNISFKKRFNLNIHVDSFTV